MDNKENNKTRNDIKETKNALTELQRAVDQWKNTDYINFSWWHISDIDEDKLLELLGKKITTADINNNDIIVENNDNVFKDTTIQYSSNPHI